MVTVSYMSVLNDCLHMHLDKRGRWATLLRHTSQILCSKKKVDNERRQVIKIVKMKIYLLHIQGIPGVEYEGADGPRVIHTYNH